MGSRDRAARIRFWPQRRAGRDTLTVRLQYPPRPPPRPAKDFLGAAMTAAIVGAIALFLTNGLASHCMAEPDPRTGSRICSGVPALAAHIRPVETLCVLAFGALAVIAFVWYMLWGYKANGPGSGSRDGGR
jgi:hypothetical protein